MRNVPGGATMVGDIEKDIRAQEWQDVTSSSYQEQDRVNLDFDDLAGNFSQGSVMTNRKLNETVGGMRMMAQGANMLTEYDLQVYRETWVEPVLRQLAKMEQAYETDEYVLAIAGQKSGLFQRFGQSANMDVLLAQELTLTVNVGMGATDPDTRLQRFMQALMLDGKVAKEGAPDTNLKEVRKMLFGLSGFKDSLRYFDKQVDVRLVQAQQMLAQAEQQAKDIVMQAKDQLQTRARMLDEREHQMDMELLAAQQEFGREAQKAQQELMIELGKAHQKAQLEDELQRHKLGMQRDDANQKAAIARDKATLDATIKIFMAKLEASLKEMQAEVDRKVAVRKERTLEKKGPGLWKVTEH